METIRKSTLEFLKELKKNNNREWFLEMKPAYALARQNYEDFVQLLLDRLAVLEPIMKGLEVKNCVYRINRDIRFTNDKSPYKTHFGAFMVRGGRQNGDKYAGYYFHVEPGNNSMFAGGAYVPPAPWLSAIREKIDSQGDELVRIAKNPEFQAFFGDITGDSLKTPPRGYAKDHPHIKYLKLKSFNAFRMLTDREVTSEKCHEIVAKGMELVKPLNEFLNEV